MMPNRFWRVQFREARQEAEFWKSWVIALGVLFNLSVLVNIYLIYCR